MGDYAILRLFWHFGHEDVIVTSYNMVFYTDI